MFEGSCLQVDQKYTSFLYQKGGIYHRPGDYHQILLLILRGDVHTQIVAQNVELTIWFFTPVNPIADNIVRGRIRKWILYQ